MLLVELQHVPLGLRLGSLGIAAGLACNLCHPVSLVKEHAQLPANTNMHKLLQHQDHTYVLHGKLEGRDMRECSEGECSEVHLGREAIPASSPQLHCDPCKVNIGSAMSCMCMHLCEGCESSATWCQTIQQNSCCSDTRQWHILLDVLIRLHTLCMASTSVQCFQACECKPESRSTSCQTHMQGLRNSDIGKLTCARCPLLCLHPSWLS